MFLRIIIFFISIQIFSGEIVLRSEKVFNCEILTEDNEFVKVKFKGNIYKIPLEEVLFINKDVEPKYESYTISKALLPDGNVIRGRIIAEDEKSITLENSEESVAIPKTSIVKFERATEEFAVIPDKFLFEKKEDRELKNNFGFYISGMSNINQFYNKNDLFNAQKVIHPYSIILGYYMNPEYLKFKKIQTGIDVFIHTGLNLKESYSIFSFNYYYLQKFLNFETSFFYFQLGPSISYMNFIEGDRAKRFGALGIFFDIGFQKNYSDNLHFKFSIRYLNYFRENENYISVGPILSFGKQF